MSNLQQFAFGSQSVRVISVDGDPWFVATDVLSAIKSTTKINALKSVIAEGLGDGFVDSAFIPDKLRRVQETTIIHKLAVSFLLSKSRKPLALDLAKMLNLPNTVTHSKQSETISIIQNALIHLNPIEEFFIAGYRIDLYFPSHRIAIECDEIYHQRHQQEDKARQDAITKLLGCSWIRYCPESKDFCVGKIINQILKRL